MCEVEATKIIEQKRLWMERVNDNNVILCTDKNCHTRVFSGYLYIIKLITMYQYLSEEKVETREYENNDFKNQNQVNKIMQLSFKVNLFSKKYFSNIFNIFTKLHFSDIKKNNAWLKLTLI